MYSERVGWMLGCGWRKNLEGEEEKVRAASRFNADQLRRQRSLRRDHIPCGDSCGTSGVGGVGRRILHRGLLHSAGPGE
jgi:hypothetical protein